MDILSKSDYEFDIKLVKECVNSFSKATGLGCTVSDTNDTVLISTVNSINTYNLCSISQKKHRCMEAHSYGMNEAERFGGRYIYYCPAGLTFFVSPIMNQIGSVAKVTVGPFLMIEKDDYDYDELQDKLDLNEEQLKYSREIINRIPFVEPDKVTALSNILYYSIGFINNVWKADQMRQLQASDAIQASINEYISELKISDEQRFYPVETEKQLLKCIANGDKKRASEALNELLGYIFFASVGDIERMKTGTYELLVIMTHATLEYRERSDSMLQRNYMLQKQLMSFKNIESLCAWITQLLDNFMSTAFIPKDVRHSDIVFKTLQFIGNNYNRKITTEDAARNVYLSPSYFSSTFKKETGYSFSEMLKKMRIDKAKSIMHHREYKLSDIAAMTGFEDQSYFTKVFSKYTGKLPLEYRNMIFDESATSFDNRKERENN